MKPSTRKSAIKPVLHTAFCQSTISDQGTWIGTVAVAPGQTAIERSIADARTLCAMDWGLPRDEIVCIGLIPGRHKAAYWDEHAKPEAQP